MAAAFLVEAGIEPILQLACRDRNRIALQAELMAAAAAGVRNLLVLRGDDPSAGDQPEAKAVFDLDSRRLIETARLLRDRGELPSGRKVAGKAPFFLGAADMPIDPAPGWKPDSLRAKIEAGAQFVQTQFCMDVGIVRRYVQRLAEHGIPDRLFILIGVAPLRSAKSARWIAQHLPGAIIPVSIIERMEKASDAAAEGRRICLELMEQFAEVDGIAGAHVMAPGHDAAVAEVLAKSGQIARRRRGK
jgi:methylenetetrahydrofolate reductase (NADPH)